MPAPQARIAAAGGALVFAGFVLMPTGLLEGLVLASGIPAVLAAAEPPLGFTARIGLGGVFGGLFAAFLWFGLGLLEGDSGIAKAVMARLRARDAHPDAPRRAPLSILELGEPAPPPAPPAKAVAPTSPPPAPVIERPLPADLDQRLAAFDPAAILETPMPAPEPIAPLIVPVAEPVAITPPSPPPPPSRPALIDPGDRFETFELTPVQRPSLLIAEPAPPAPSLRASPDLRGEPAPVAAEPIVESVVAAETELTVNALLARLERGLAVVPPAPDPVPDMVSNPAPNPVPNGAAVEPGPAPIPAEPPVETPRPLPSLRTGRVLDALGDLRALAVAPR